MPLEIQNKLPVLRQNKYKMKYKCIMRKETFKLISALFLTSSFTMYSCVDNDYDLTKDIDLTISVGGSEFAIPGGMTEEIKLSKVLELEDEDLVKTDENGDYFLLKKAEKPTTNTIKIDDFTVAAPKIKPIQLDIRFADPLRMLTKAGSGDKYSYEVETTFSEPFQIQQNGLPEELKKLSTIKTDITAQIKFTFVQNYINRLWFEDIKIEFPEYIISNELTNHCLIIKNESVVRNGGLTKTIHIQGIDCKALPQGEGLDSDNHSLNITGKVSIGGMVYVTENDFSNTPNFPINLSLKTDVALGNIKAKEITGVVKPDIDIQADPILLNGIPDFLADDEVRLDVKNPMVFLTVNNGSPVEARVDGKLSSYKKDKQEAIAGPIDFTIPSIEANKEQVFCISALETLNPNTNNIVVPDLGLLVNQIPDEIRFTIDAEATDKEVDIKLNNQYTLTTDYEVNVPFVFGKNLSIVYKDTIDGWMEDIEDYEVQLVHATATAINKIPLALIFTAEAITVDSKGEPALLDGVDIKVRTNGSESDNVIKTGNESGVETSLVIEIKETKAGSIKKLDGLFLRATAKSSDEADGKQLNENQSLQLKNLKLKVPGGLKIDLN